MSLEREQHLNEKINKSYANRLTKVNNKCDSGVYKNPGHTKCWQEAVLRLRNMYLLWKIFWIKKTALPSIKKIE
jgi:hypothetical protein